MKHLFKQLICGGVVLAPAFLLTGCIVSDYDDLDNIDLTMGLGSDGLGVRLGNTEKILLSDILSVDQSVKLDGNNLYYLVESGSSDFEVKINPLDIDLNIPELEMELEVLDYDKVKEQLEKFLGTSLPNADILIHKDDNFIPTGLAESVKDQSSFTVEGFSDDVKRINWVSFTPTEVSLVLHEMKTSNVKFGIEEVKNMTIHLPEALRVTKYPQQTWKLDAETNTLTQIGPLVLKGTDLEICKVTIDGADVNADVSNNEKVERQNDIYMKGDIAFHVTEDFTMHSGDYVTVELEFQRSDDKLHIQDVNGRFCPVVNNEETQTTEIDIAKNLPDFLQDENVRVSVSNPTLKFNADLENIPVGFNFGAVLTAKKQGKEDIAVTLPSVDIDNNLNSTVYFYQGAQPYDPGTGDVYPNVVKMQVGGPEDKVNKETKLSDLIKELPDNITVDFGKDQIGVQDKDYTLHMGSTYNTSAAYDIYVPFEFDNELKIVYRDSTNSFGDDIKDYAAHGVRVSAKIQNTIPLALDLNLTAVTADGELVPGVSFTTLTVPAATTDDLSKPEEKEVSIEGTLSDPNKLKEIDHLVFNVTAAGTQSDADTRKLVSTQYLRLTDVRISLKGQVIANFN